MTVARVRVNQQQLKESADKLRDVRYGIRDALRLAIWDTTKQIRTDTSTRIREKVNIKKQDVDRYINLKRPEVKDGKPSGKMTLSSGGRLPLKYFGAKKTSKGVTYKIDKKGQAVVDKDLFISDSLEGHVFHRKKPGTKKKREKKPKRFTPAFMKTGRGPRRIRQYMWPELPIKRAKGVSAYGVVKKNDMVGPIAEAGTAFLENNINRRVNFLILKQQNKLSWQIQ